MHAMAYTTPAAARGFLVTDDVIEDYLHYRRQSATRDLPEGATPIYFHQWFDNLWQAEPIDRLVGADD